ncbi:hypothetical protein C6A85_70645, partial [Mycobacterium sp. ITM-2017-0098]
MQRLALRPDAADLDDLAPAGDWTIAAGCVAGIDVRWTGVAGQVQILGGLGVGGLASDLVEVGAECVGDQLHRLPEDARAL